MSIQIKINGADIDHTDAQGRDRGYHYGTSGQIWNLITGSQGNCDVPVICPPDDSFAPDINDDIDVYEIIHSTSTRVWTGKVTGLSVKYIGDDGWSILTIKGSGLEVQVATAQVGQMFAGVSSAAAAGSILSAVGSGDISSGLIETGPTVESLPVRRASDGLDALALMRNGLWYIDPEDRSLNLHAKDSRPVSDELVDGDIRWETIEWDQDSTDQRTTQDVSGSAGSATSGSGNPTQASTLGGGGTQAGLQQLADAAVAQYSSNPPKVSFVTDRTDFGIGRWITINITTPVPAATRLNGSWLVQEVDAMIEPGLDQDHTRRPAPWDQGHFIRTLHLVKSPTQTYVKAADQLTNVAEPPVPGLPPPGQLFDRVLQIYDTTVRNRVGNSVPVHATGKALDAIGMLHVGITADLVVEVVKGGVSLVTITIPYLSGSPATSTPIDTSIYFPVMEGSPAVPAQFTLGEPLVWNIISSDGSTDATGIATITLRWQA